MFIFGITLGLSESGHLDSDFDKLDRDTKNALYILT